MSTIAMAVVLDSQKPLRDSLLWALQDAFYDQVNIRAWSEAIVPNFVTSNCYIASCYAKLAVSFARDLARSGSLNAEEPIYMVEVGAGHGKLSYLVIRRLLELREFWPPGCSFVYVLTDFTAHNVEFWKSHEPFDTLMKEGLVDFAVLDAENDREITLQLRGAKLGPDTVKNPMVVVCNYIFDTLRQDAFRVVDRQLQEALCTVLSSHPVDNPTHPDVIKLIKCEWHYRPCSVDYYEDDPQLNAVLAQYTRLYNSASILVPLGGLRMLRNLAHVAGGRLLMLCGDKAYSHEEELMGLRDPHVAIHGSFSFMVNFHAVRLFVQELGGFGLQTPLYDGFKCCAFALGVPQKDCRELRCEWMDSMEQFGPENFSTLQRCLKDETPSPTLKTAVAVIRLSQHDSDVFYKFKQVLIDKAPFATEKQQADLRLDMEAVVSNYYPLQRSKDVPFEAGRVFMGLKQYARAAELFDMSQRLCGEHHVSWYNTGICHYYTAQFEDSIRCFDRALEMRPNYHDARAWKARVEAKVAELEEELAAAAMESGEGPGEGGAVEGEAAGEVTGEDAGDSADAADGAGAGAGAGADAPPAE